jgi:hypothetical protein
MASPCYASHSPARATGHWCCISVVVSQARHPPHCMTMAPGWKTSITRFMIGLNSAWKVSSLVPSCDSAEGAPRWGGGADRGDGATITNALPPVKAPTRDTPADHRG